MEGVLGYTKVSTFTKIIPQIHCNFYKIRKMKLRVSANLSNGDDPLLQAAINAATLRFHETLRENGADTRAYRLTWPNSTLIFDISAEKIYSELSSKLRDVGAQITRNCLLIHVPKESPNVQEALRKKGFNGNRPSIWILQGLPLMTLANFENVLSTVGSLAMKGCLLIGEIPAELIEPSHEVEVGEWIHRIFMSHGFQVKVYDHEQIAKNLGAELLKEPPNSILFVAEHLRFSDDQVCKICWTLMFADIFEFLPSDGDMALGIPES
ncbi:O-methyltransferase 1, chloroplastic-like isoform X3 [Silene latifolia]|uniref:O-methyltransferase 1, chloroplastic-like isoform X3 n=1 Tax=Silene latifolia TaxID=37657 RepID=UPI003D77CFA6